MEKSRFHNPYKVLRKGEEEAAVNSFDNYLHNLPGLLDDLHTLSGKRLLCHCKPWQEWCHAVPIIRAFMEAKDMETKGIKCKREDVVEPACDKDEGNFKKGKLGDGWPGRGSPLQVPRRGTWRDLRDGLGLCSPEKWKIEDRRLPENMETFHKLLTVGVKRMLDKMGVSAKILVMKMALGRCETSPFDTESVKLIKETWHKELSKRGRDPYRRQVDVKQFVDLRLIQALCLEAGDPEGENWSTSQRE